MYRKSRTHRIRTGLLVVLLLFCGFWALDGARVAWAGLAGLPFSEDFADTALQDPALTNANWSTDEQALVLAWRHRQYGAFASGLSGNDISTDSHSTESVALGDVDGDGDLDLIAGNADQTNRLYLNNGTDNPWNGVTGSDITGDSHSTQSVALGDVDGDGDLDLVAGNIGNNRLYLNNGTADPWNGVFGSDITSDNHQTLSVALRDVDGDGDLDLVAGNFGRNRLYLNNGTADPWNGVFGSEITNDSHQTISVALGDVDGDGNLDLVAGNLGQTNRLYLNNGTADPWSGVTGSDITSDSHNTISVALGDVDGDGDLDLVAGNSGQTNRLYLNNGTADPWNGVTGSDITSDSHSTQSVALGDVDGDGDLDLVVGNYPSQRNRLYLNNGTADPWNGVTGSDITSDSHATRSVTLGDVDGDGDMDLVVGNWNQTNRLYVNKGTANPWNGVAGSNITSDSHNTESVVLGDVDGDGDLDLVAGNISQPNRLYLNNGTANPWNGVSGSDITGDIRDTESVALGDVDGDGDLDLVTGNYGRNRLYLNNGTANPWNGVFGSDITGDSHDTESVALGDVDGDGDVDLVAGNSGQPNRLYLNNGTADPWNGVSGSNITSDSDYTWSVVLGDVDGDGDLDLVAGNFVQPNRLHLNNGTADPWNGVSGRNITGDSHTTWSVVLGDVDGDGDLDLVAGNIGDPNRLYLNNGTDNPWNGVTGSNITSDSHTTWSVVLGDVDGDGDLDLIAGNTGRNRLYLNNGTANPWNGVSGSNITSDSDLTFPVALGDVDGDGDLDLIAGNSGRNRLYLNGGVADPWNGVSASDITGDSHNTYAVALGDVDGDGDLDLVAGNLGQTNRLYLNNGTANPWNGVAGSDITSDSQNTYSVALGDVDGDGDLDLVAGTYVETNRLYLNNGTADPFDGVTGSNITSDIYNTRSVALGDVDGDGDLDLVAGNYGQRNRLYLNNGTADPFDGVTGSDITTDNHRTWSVALGDVDGDGDMDVVAGNEVRNRLYLNKGTTDPFDGVSGSDISTDSHETYSVALGDVDNDGDLDLVAGNSNQPNRLYLNNGTADPWSGASGSDITSDSQVSWSVTLGDVDSDGDLDLVVGNFNQTNRLYLNKGTTDPFDGVSGSDITGDSHGTRSVALGDVDDDGNLDLVAGNSNQTNRLYRRQLYDTSRGWAGSLRVDSESDPIPNVTLTSTAVVPDNTAIDYWLSNDGGSRWYLVRPDVNFTFPTSGTDLRWRAQLTSLSPVLTPRLESLSLETLHPNVAIAKTVEPVLAVPGDSITYTLSFSNTGQYIASSVVLSDSVPVSVTVSGVTSSTFGFSGTGSGVIITQTSDSPDFVWDVSDLAAGAGGWITLTGTLDADLSIQDIVNTATITASNDITSTNNSASVSLHVNGILYVDTDASGSATGVSWTDAFTNVQDALALAASGDEIWVAAGVYYPDEGGGQTDDNRSASFQLTSGMGLYGGFAGTETARADRDWTANVTVLSGDIDRNDTTDANGVVITTTHIVDNNAYHVLFLDGTTTPVTGTTVIDGVTITAGQADEISGLGTYGGGLYCDGSGNDSECSPTLANVSFSGNSAETSGGAMYNSGFGGTSSPVLTNVIFSGNSAGYQGGAMYNNSYDSGSTSSPVLTNVSFSGNSASYFGGAMYNHGFGSGSTSSPVLTNVSFSGNSVGYQGGAMVSLGISNGVSSPSLTNVSFNGNSATDSGGAMVNLGNSNGLSSPSLTNVSFSGNSANQGGAVLNEARSGGTSSPSLTNVILWGNTASYGSQMYNASASLVITTSLVEGGWNGSGIFNDSSSVTDGGGNIAEDPLFVDAANGDLRLQVGSPARDVGLSSAVPAGVATDLDGNPRFIGTVDMGAYEVQYVDVAVTKSVTPAIAAPGAVITYTLSFTNTGPTAGENVVISDSLPVSVTVSGVTSSTVGGVIITQTSGSPDFVWDVSDLAVGAGGYITLTGTLTDTFIAATTVDNTAAITATNDITATNNNSSAGVAIVAGPFVYAATGGEDISVERNGDLLELRLPSLPSVVIRRGIALLTNVDISTIGVIDLAGHLDAGSNAVTLNGTVKNSQSNNPDITGNVTLNGTLAPGASPAVVTFNGDMTFSAGDTFEVDIDGTTPGAEGYDQLQVTGSGRTVTLGNATLLITPTITPAAGDQFVIIDAAASDSTIVGTFAGLPQQATLLAGGHKFYVTYKGGIDSNDVVLVACSDAITVLNTNDSGAGSLRQAVVDLCPGGQIDFDAALNNQIIDITGHIIINKDMTIDGPGSALITVRGNGGGSSGRVFRVDSGAIVTMQGLGVTGRQAGEVQGGGIYNAGDLTLYDVAVFGNMTGVGFGGGIYNSGQMTITTSAVYGNITHAGSGGGIYNSGVLSITNSSVYSNSAFSDFGFGGSGGGFGNAGTLTVESTAVYSNTADTEGGGIYSSGSLLVTNSRVYANQASKGGGISASGGAVIEYSSIISNSAQSGAGLYARPEPPSFFNEYYLENSEILSNTASNSAGGIYWDSGSADLTAYIFGSTIAYNSSNGDGGGMRMGANAGVPTVYVTNSTINHNRTNQDGGGFANDGELTLLNVTVTSNIADADADDSGDGGGVSGTASVHNSIIADNQDLSSGGQIGPIYPDVSGSFSSGGYNVIGDNTGDSGSFIDGLSGDQVGSSASPLDPLLGPLQDNGGPTIASGAATFTHALQNGSPALNRGDPGGCLDDSFSPLTNDQRDFDRPDNASNRCDVGAVEMQSVDVGIAKNASPAMVGTGETITYTLVITASGTTDPALSVVITDAIPVSLTVTSVISSGIAFNQTATSPYGWQVDSLPVGATGYLTITGVVSNATSLLGTTVTNTAEISASNDSYTGNNAGSAAFDVVGVTIGVSPASVDEDGAVDLTYTFTRAGPTASPLVVSFDVGGTATFVTDYTQSGADSFTASNGTVTIPASSSTATVVVDPTPDTLAELDETVILTVTAGSGYGVGTPASATGTISDNDSAGVTVSPTSGLVTTEAGGTDSFTVALNSQPTAAVTVTLTSSNTSEGTVSPAELVFASANWDTAQTVTVTGVDDDVDDGDVAFTINTSVSSGDANYDGFAAADVSVTNTDDDGVGVTVSPTSGLVTTEAGGTDSFTIVLNSQPTATVTVTLASSDTSEGTVSPAQLVFTSVNWNTAQTVTVTGVDDDVDDGDIGFTITTGVVSNDTAYAAIDPADVGVTNMDDDGVGVTVSPTTGLVTTEAGGTDSFTVVLDSQPTATVTVTLTSSDPSEGTVSPAQLVFTPANWNTAQTVTVTGVDDNVDDGDVAFTITTGVVSNDTAYAAIDPADVSVTNTDDDGVGVTVSPTTGLVTTEAGGTDSFTVVLNSQPTATVTVTLTSSNTSEGTVSPAELVFTSANWNTAQTVTVTGVDDDVDDGDIVFSITTGVVSNDAAYAAIDPADVSVTNTDNDSAGVTVSPTTGLVTTEAGGTDSFTVVLNSQPTATVTVTLASSDPSEGTISPAEVVFTSANWDTAQTVTVTGVDDDVDDGDVAFTINTSVVSNDTAYAAIDPADVGVTNLDDDMVVLVIHKSVDNATPSEGSSVTYTIRISNTGTATATGVQVMDSVSGSLASGVTLVGGGQLSYTYTVMFPNGPATVVNTATVTSDQTAAVSSVTTVMVKNVAPSAEAGGPYTVNEGSSVQLNGSGSDVAADTLTYTWDLDGDGSFETNGQNPTFDAVALDGPATITVTLRVSDEDGGSSAATAMVTVANVAPTVLATVDHFANPFRHVTLEAFVEDPGVGDSHTATIDWGDAVVETFPVVGGGFESSHVYVQGAYTITITVVDDDGGVGTAIRHTSVGPALIYLPLVMLTGPDLVVSAVAASPTGVQITVRNQGNSPVLADFWVDLYYGPDTAPTQVNQLWSALGTQGAAWGVTQDLAPGQEVVLTLGDGAYFDEFSNMPSALEPGVPIYVQVDAWGDSPIYGAVNELDELPGRIYNNIPSQTTADPGIRMQHQAQTTTGVEPSHLPVRPAIGQ